MIPVVVAMAGVWGLVYVTPRNLVVDVVVDVEDGSSSSSCMSDESSVGDDDDPSSCIVGV